MGTFNKWTSILSEESGCDWDFLIEMYNYIHDSHGDVDWDRFECGVMSHDWSVRNGDRFENILITLSEDSGYSYDELLAKYANMIYDPYDDGDWEYFVGVTMEHDW